MGNKKQDSLCWSCSQCYGSCSWSKSFKPVEGWTAKNTKYKDESNLVESYLVIECPKYIYDGKFFENN